ncbi:TetR/AcrR family transcriptional regulator [Geitlerinema sp. PCC 7407]|uniref:TetR/AcrR family transcriptional regulator n=1 Tax=Geitlerinema sp. PCC 7407 TaxID=1173025 RepID=UPI00029FC073|nr:TetR/AcrR family transcriptional regulator [Geitlerinema sp. PCC 7407]AFY67451.1 transcriptional regulator, TetR family [Geitlerinema sp. PCC 7407]
MSKNGQATRQRILDAAETLVLQHSLAGTSIDMVLAQAGITKGAFFYHFKSKSALAEALVERYLAQETLMLQELVQRAERLSRDPLQQVLIFLGLFQEVLEQADTQAGCLVASYVYQMADLSEEIRAIAAQGFADWRQDLSQRFETIMAQYPPRYPVTATDLANGFLVVVEGSLVLLRVLQEAQHPSQQLAHYRNYLELLFLPDR